MWFYNIIITLVIRPDYMVEIDPGDIITTKAAAVPAVIVSVVSFRES